MATEQAPLSCPFPSNKIQPQRNDTPWKVLGEAILLFFRSIYYILEAGFRRIVPVPSKSVKGEIVLITGAGHGIGRELALLYAAEGATVVSWDINKKGNQETVAAIAKLGYPKAHSYVCDVTNREAVLTTSKKVEEEVGDVSILINNAGIMPCKPFLRHSVEEIERMMNINVMAHFWTLQAFLPNMLKNNHGHIVALSSCAGLSPIRNLMPYCASKFAVRGMMEALDEDLRQDPKNQIHLTTIYPYMVDTGLCAKPVIRFPNSMPLLKPKDVAKQIMNAQRKDLFEASLPSKLLNTQVYVKLYPRKVGLLLRDFLEAYPAAHEP